MPIRPLFLLVVLLLEACASQRSASPSADLTVDHFIRTTTQTTLAAGNRVRFSTEAGHEEPYETPREFQSSYLLATIDRETGVTGFALNVMDTTRQPRARARVTYESPEGWMEQTVRVQNGARQCKGGDCWNLESIPIGLKEDLLRTYAGRHGPGMAAGWRYRIEPSIAGEIPLAEIAGLLARVDQYRAGLRRQP